MTCRLNSLAAVESSDDPSRFFLALQYTLLAETDRCRAHVAVDGLHFAVLALPGQVQQEVSVLVKAVHHVLVAHQQPHPHAQAVAPQIGINSALGGHSHVIAKLEGMQVFQKVNERIVVSTLGVARRRANEAVHRPPGVKETEGPGAVADKPNSCSRRQQK